MKNDLQEQAEGIHPGVSQVQGDGSGCGVKTMMKEGLYESLKCFFNGIGRQWRAVLCPSPQAERKNPIKITGEQIMNGVNSWVADEIKSGPYREYDLGKFLFTVGSGTIGFLLVAVKLDRSAGSWNCAMIASFTFLLISIIISMVMVLPKRWEIEDGADLFDKRNSIIRRTRLESILWFLAWLLGTFFGVCGVLTQS